jgi:hypothetical protein
VLRAYGNTRSSGVRLQNRPVVKEIVDQLHDVLIARHTLQFDQHRVDLVKCGVSIYGKGETH